MLKRTIPAVIICVAAFAALAAEPGSRKDYLASRPAASIPAGVNNQKPILKSEVVKKVTGSGLDITTLTPGIDYVTPAGVEGGQTINSDTASGGNLSLRSTVDPVKGKILLDDVAYSYKRTSGDPYANGDNPPDAGLFAVNGANAGDVVGLSFYNYGAMLFYRGPYQQLEFWGGTQTKGYHAVTTLVADDEYKELQVRNNTDTNSIILHYPGNGDPFISTQLDDANLLITAHGRGKIRLNKETRIEVKSDFSGAPALTFGDPLLGDFFNFRRTTTGNNLVIDNWNGSAWNPALTIASNTGEITAVGTIAAANLSGTNTGDQTIVLSGDVTGSGTGSFAATIAAGAVTLAKMADMPAATLLGRNTAGSGPPEALPAGAARSLLGIGSLALLDNPLITAGDLWVGGVSGVPERLAAGMLNAPLLGGGAGTAPAYASYTLAAPGALGAVLYSDGSNWVRSTAPAISAVNMNSFPTLNQNTTGTAGGLSAAYIDWNATTGGESILNKPAIPTVSDAAYDAISWDGNMDAPTKNAIRDYLESKAPTGTDGTYGVTFQNNTARSPLASTYELYFSGGVFKVNENGIERIPVYTDTVTPITVGDGGTAVAPKGYYVVTGTTAEELPVAAAGNEFCIMQDVGGSSVLTVAPPAGGYLGQTDNSAYCTHDYRLVSGGASVDRICMVGGDNSHYMVLSFSGTWTCTAPQGG